MVYTNFMLFFFFPEGANFLTFFFLKEKNHIDGYISRAITLGKATAFQRARIRAESLETFWFRGAQCDAKISFDIAWLRRVPRMFVSDAANDYTNLFV